MSVKLANYKQRLEKQKKRLESDLEYYGEKTVPPWEFYQTRAKLSEIKILIGRVNNIQYPMHLVNHLERLKNNHRMGYHRYWRGTILHIISFGFFKTTTQNLISDGIKLGKQLEKEQTELNTYKGL